MTDYISREAAIESFRKNLDGGYVLTDDAQTTHILQSLPAADVRPVLRGNWEDVEVQYIADKTTLPFERISSMRCNRCNRYHTEIFYYGNPTEMAHFCPNCGADMREEQDGR